MPPLTKIDWAELGFREKDEHPTPIPAPTDVPLVSTVYPGGPHLIMVMLSVLPGTLAISDRGDYGFARYENQKGQKGSWGPVASAIIP
jgi:hypothetical protein